MLRVLLTGGGSGGHIYPLIAVAEEFAEMDNISVQLSYVGPRSKLNQEFIDRNIKVYRVLSSKIRRYFSLQNIIDIPKFLLSLIQAIIRLYIIMPDVVFSKGGPGSLAVVWAAKFYFIPVIIHESDAVPGLTNRIAAKSAKRIAVSFPDAIAYFPKKKTALTGTPLRKEILERMLTRVEGKGKLGFDPNAPLVLVLGGSQGAEQLNDFVLKNLQSLISFTQVFHQTGPANFDAVKNTANVILKDIGPTAESRYRSAGYMSVDMMKDALSAADVIISRAGSAIAEIAAFGKPSILIPLETSANGHQKANAYGYSKTGAAIVFERNNFTYHVVELKIKEIFGNAELYENMSRAARSFSRIDAAKAIAEEIVNIASK